MSLIAVYVYLMASFLSPKLKLTCMGILRCNHRCKCTITCGTIWNGKGTMDVNVVAVDARMSRWCEYGIGH